MEGCWEEDLLAPANWISAGGVGYCCREPSSCGANILQYSPAVFNFSRNAFYWVSPTIWNNLPETVISDITVSTDTFKTRLKTALYSRAFLHWQVTFCTWDSSRCERPKVHYKPSIIIIILLYYNDNDPLEVWLPSHVLLRTICCWLSYSCKLLLPLWEPPLAWLVMIRKALFCVASKFWNLIAKSQGCWAEAAKSKQLWMSLIFFIVFFHHPHSFDARHASTRHLDEAFLQTLTVW